MKLITFWVLFLHVEKAYDSINHKLLLYNLEKYGVWAISYEIVRSFLPGKKQQVWINGILSEEKFAAPNTYFREHF